MLGLCGDTSDNIPGVPGIGPKTAAKLLAEYDNVENLIEHVDALKGKQQERVREHADQASFIQNAGYNPVGCADRGRLEIPCNSKHRTMKSSLRYSQNLNFAPSASVSLAATLSLSKRPVTLSL